jgi:hypothetical protein
MSQKKPDENFVSTAISSGMKKLGSKSVPWYLSTITKIIEPAWEILNKYSGIPPDQILSHVVDLVRMYFQSNVNCLQAG